MFDNKSCNSLVFLAFYLQVIKQIIKFICHQGVILKLLLLKQCGSSVNYFRLASFAAVINISSNKVPFKDRVYHVVKWKFQILVHCADSFECLEIVT